MLDGDFDDLVTIRLALLKMLVLVKIDDYSPRRKADTENAVLEAFKAVRRMESRRPVDAALPCPSI